jgi:hypothetical protein
MDGIIALISQGSGEDLVMSNPKSEIRVPRLGVSLQGFLRVAALRLHAGALYSKERRQVETFYFEGLGAIIDNLLAHSKLRLSLCQRIVYS